MATTSLSFAVLLTVALIPAVIHGLIQCKDSSGNDVDWYYIYKLPKNSQALPPWMGDAYYFLSNLKNKFTLSTSATGLTNPTNPLAKTLSPVYQKGKKLVIMYNDHPPDGSSASSKGHTKGVVACDGSTGFWLIHSIPRFPDKTAYQWPASATIYGQSVLCITFSKNSMTAIANQLQYMFPKVYFYEGVSTSSPFWKVIMAQRPPKSDNKANLISSGGQQFIHYAKYNSFGKDLYSGLVAKDLKQKLYVETWRRKPELQSDCSTKYPVCNVAAVTLPGKQSFSYTKDHSKWAVTVDKKYICVGGINRMSSQFRRGGGTMCANLPVVATQYFSIARLLQTCPAGQRQLCP